MPNDISEEIALLTILSNDASKGVGKLNLQPDASVLITEAGTMGLLALHRLRWLGFENVDVVEPLPERGALALELGARAVYVPDTLPETARYTAGVDSSTQAGFSLLQRHLNPNG